MDQETLKAVIHYDPETGIFTNLKNGKKMGGINANGYVIVCVKRKGYRAHRLAFLYMEGNLPPDQVDHINGIRADNRWKNLRHATSAENAKNQCRHSHCPRSIMGLQYKHQHKNWRVFLGSRTLGERASLLDACALRKSAEIRHGYHSGHGKAKPEQISKIITNSIKGISYHRKQKCWRVQLNGKALGQRASLLDACSLRKSAELMLAK